MNSPKHFFKHFLLLVFSFFSIVSLTYAATTIGNNIFTSGTLTSQGKAYLTGGADVSVLNATSSLIDNLTAKKIVMFSNSIIINTKNDLGVIYKDSYPFIYTFGYGWNGTTAPYGWNFFAGYNAGNLTMGSTASFSLQSSFNTGIGDFALRNNTTGYNNTALGTNVLMNNSVGSGNTGIGSQALFGCTTGYNNTAVGSETLYGLDTGTNNTAVGNNVLHTSIGSYNTGVGAGSLTLNTSGNNNTALGFNSLFSNTTGYNNIGIGYNAKTAGAADYNEVVIGANAVGAGSNSVVLGNNDITKTLLKGNVGIGTTTPTNILTVEGSSYLDGTVTTPLLNSTSSLIDNLTANNLTLGTGKLILPSTVATNGNKGIIYKDGIPFLYDFSYGTNANGVIPYGHNLFLGKNAGNLNMGSTASLTFQSSYNVGIGYGVLYWNTVGYYNVGVGANSLGINNTGYDNVAVGTYSLWDNSVGFGNVALGTATMQYNTTGYGNTAVGNFALNGITTGHVDVGIGTGTKLAASSDYNEVVIGANAVGAGSNSVVLGNDNITKTLLKGNVGIASTTPEEALTVGGNIYASGSVTSTNMNLIKVKFTPSPTPTDPVIGDCFMDNGAKPQINCYDGTTWHPLW